MTHKENTSGECKAQLVTKWAPVSSPALLFSSSLLPCRAVLIPPCFCFQYFPPSLLHPTSQILQFQGSAEAISFPVKNRLVHTPPLLQNRSFPTLCPHVQINIMATCHSPAFTYLLPPIVWKGMEDRTAASLSSVS